MLINIKLNGQRGIIAVCSQRVKTYWSSQILMKKVKVLIAQFCLTLYNSLDYSPPGSSVHEFFQARILEWVVIPFFRDFPTQGLNLGLLYYRQVFFFFFFLPSEPSGKAPRSLNR